jgi:hypothetical protein
MKVSGQLNCNMNIIGISQYHAHHIKYLQIFCEAGLNLYLKLSLDNTRQASINSAGKETLMYTRCLLTFTKHTIR